MHIDGQVPTLGFAAAGSNYNDIINTAIAQTNQGQSTIKGLPPYKWNRTGALRDESSTLATKLKPYVTAFISAIPDSMKTGSVGDGVTVSKGSLAVALANSGAIVNYAANSATTFSIDPTYIAARVFDQLQNEATGSTGWGDLFIAFVKGGGQTNPFQASTPTTSSAVDSTTSSAVDSTTSSAVDSTESGSNTTLYIGIGVAALAAIVLLKR